MLVTLTGGAGAGKTTLATALAATASRAPVRVFHGDDYYFGTPERGVWMPDEAGVPRLDVGDPRSMDLGRLGHDVDAALTAASVVIVDGLFARRVTLTAPCPRFDVFVDLPADLRLARKIQRKCLRDGFPLDVLLRNYLNHRRTAHEKYVEPVRHDCDLIVDGGAAADVLARRIWTEATGKGLTRHADSGQQPGTAPQPEACAAPDGRQVVRAPRTTAR
ncbi:uridine kinase family protein [Streptomyces celluloflavus]|uniref:uridine kinase family protein n=1 Tax=Streptomyces celluloflavus TaxID=58344 RepID=UPI003663C214